MKKLLYVASALAALALLAPNAGYAQTAFNQVGIYSTNTGTPGTENFNATPFVGFSGYLVLTKPVNHAFAGGTNTSVPVTSLAAYEFRLTIPTEGFLKTGDILPPGALNVGSAPDYVIGLATPLAVTNQAAVLATFSFLALDALPKNIFLGPTSAPGVPGQMSFIDMLDPPLSAGFQVMYPSSGSAAAPVFSVNGAAVAIENQSWGNVKSLFR